VGQNQNQNDEFLFCFCPFCCCFGFGFAPQWERIGKKQNDKTYNAKANWAKTSVEKTKFSLKRRDHS
jgi:hypothetical protein